MISKPQRWLFTFVPVVAAGILAFTCKEPESHVDELGRANLPAPAQSGTSNETMEKAMAAMPRAISGGSGKRHEGTIISTEDVTDYTYIQFKDTQGLIHWAAVLKGKFSPGQQVAIVESIVMKDFKSPTLGRTFDSIIFGNVEGTAAEKSVSSAPSETPGEHPPIKRDENATSRQLPEGHPPIPTEESSTRQGN